jgi:MerR family transcriptional regulator, glutamine synthetase repressor
MTNNESIYPMSVVIGMTNLTARQIRYYETNGLIKPARSKGNQRLYTPSDVETLLLIKTLLDKGLNLDGIKAVLEGEKSTEGISKPATSAPNTSTIFSPQRPSTPNLTSLYPVNNQEALNSWLQRKRK